MRRWFSRLGVTLASQRLLTPRMDAAGPGYNAKKPTERQRLATNTKPRPHISGGTADSVAFMRRRDA
jgi:hypothetical protein